MMMTSTASADLQQKDVFPLQDLLDFYQCFALVLLKLDELFSQNTNSAGIKWPIEVIKGRFHQGLRGKNSPWTKWLDEPEQAKQKNGEAHSEKEKKLPTVYKLRDFYALDAPNNLAMRFTEMEKASHSENREWRYDDYIREWGLYARNMVCINGGWRSFLKQTDPENVIDFWPSSSSRMAMKAAEPDSFVRRVLALYHDRYVQVLAAPVASLWPLWLLRTSEFRKKLRAIQAIEKDKKIRIGRALPSEDDELYIDINIKVGKRKGLPFPFGFADNCLEDDLQRPPFWNQEASESIEKKLKTFHWAPPLLFGTRSDRLRRPRTPGKTEVIPFLTLSGQIPGYAAIYKRRTQRSPESNQELDAKPLSSTKVYAIPPGWGKAVIERLKESFPDSRDNFQTRNISFASKPNQLDCDIILSHFPADIFFQDCDRFFRLSHWQYYRLFEKSGEALNYVLPATILAGSSLLAKQPKTRSLLVDFSAYLGKIELLFRWLTPDKESLAGPLDRIRFAQGKSQRESKMTAARDLEHLCRGIAEGNPLVENGPIRRSFLPDTFRKIANEMANTMFDEGVQDQSRAIIENWAWAQMLEYVDRFFVYLSQDLFV
jgi:hypothetical protein